MNENGFKDVAAILGRIVIENIASREKIVFSEKPKL
jgi:hypothetical protein